MNSLTKKWKDAKRPKLEYYIANINPSESYDEILRGGEDLYVYVCLIHTSRLGALKDEYPLTFVLRSYGSILASLWTLKISIYLSLQIPLNLSISYLSHFASPLAHNLIVLMHQS